MWRGVKIDGMEGAGFRIKYLEADRVRGHGFAKDWAVAIVMVKTWLDGGAMVGSVREVKYGNG